MAPVGPIEAEQHALESVDTLSERLISDAAELKAHGLQLDRQMSDMRSELMKMHVDPNTNADYLALDSDYKATLTRIDELKAQWIAATGKKPERFDSKLDNYYYWHYEDSETRDKGPLAAQDREEEARAEREATQENSTDENPSDKKRVKMEAARARTEVVTQTQMDVGQFKVELEKFFQAKESLAHASQLLYDAECTPVDLVGTDKLKQEQAINAVFSSNPALARYIIVELNNPDSLNRKDILGSLEKMHTTLQASFDAQRTAREATEMIERGTLEGSFTHKLKEAAQTISKDPVALVSFVAGIYGLYLLYSSREEGTKSMIKTGLGILAGGYFINTVSKVIDPQHRSLLDRAGINLGDVVAPDIVARARASMEAAHFPQEDQQSIMDLARISDMPMPGLNEAYEQALRSGTQKIDIRILQKNGLDADTAKRMDGVSLMKVADHLYGTMAYNAAIKDKRFSAPAAQNKDDQKRIGLDYARKFLSQEKVCTAIYILDPQAVDASLASSVSGVSGAPIATTESSAGAHSTDTTHAYENGASEIPDEALARLAGNNNVLARSLRSIGNGVYLIQGYPYIYSFSEGKHVFVQTRGGKDRLVLEGNAEDFKINALVSASEQAAKTELNSLMNSDTIYAAWDAGGQSDLRYNPGGYWELNPALGKMVENGLPHFKENAPVPLALSFDDQHFNIRITTATTKNYQDVTPASERLKTAREDYEKILLREKVDADIGHLLLGAGYKVQNIDNTVAGQSTLTLEFTDGKKGTLVYKNDAIDTINVASSGAAELEAKWFAAAEAEVKGSTMMESPLVQAELEKVAHDFAAKQPGIWGSFESVYADFKAALFHLTDSAVDTRFNQAFVVNMRQAQIKTRDYLLTNLYRSNKDVTRFNADKLSYEQMFVDAVRGLTEDALGHPAISGSAEARAMSSLGITATDIRLDQPGEVTALIAEGKLKIDEALQPIDDVSWQTDPNQETFFEQKKAAYEAELDAAIRVLGATPSRAAVLQAINTVYIKAATEAGQHWGKDANASMDLMVVEKLDAANRADWKDATLDVKNYLTTNMDWSKYGIIPSPSNMIRVMDLWYKNINNGTLKPASVAQAKEYAKYFLWNVSMRLGGVREFSLDSSSESAQVVSGNHFDTGFSALTTMNDFTTWLGGAPAVPPAHDMGPEAYREAAQRQFTQWFERRADPGSLTKLDGYWPQYFKANVDARFSQIVNSSDDPAVLDTRIATFKQMVLMERYGIFEQMITNRIEINKAIKFDIYEGLFNKCIPYVNANNVAGYTQEIQTFMRAQYFINWLMPNVGIPTV